MQKKTLFGLLIVVPLVVGALLWHSSSSSTSGPLKIGFVGPLTGGPALWGEGAKNTVAIAVDEINAAGGVNGRQIVVDYEDGKCTPKDAVSATQKLLSAGVKVILGGHCSTESIGMTPLSKDGAFFMLAGISSADNAISGSTYAFRTSPANMIFAQRFAQAVISEYKTVATLTEETAFGKNYTDDFTQSFTNLGGKVITAESYPAGTTDFKTVLLKLKAAHTEALFLSPQSPVSAAQIIKQMEEMGMTTPVIGNPVAISKKVYGDSGNSKLFNEAFTIIPFADLADPAIATLVAKYKARYGTDVPYNLFYVLASYDAVHMAAQAMTKCGEQPRCIANEFRAMKYQGVASMYTFKDNGDSSFDRWARYSVDDKGEHIEEIR